MPIAIPAIALVLIGLLCALLVWAGRSFADGVASLVPKDWPLVGDFPHNAFRYAAITADVVLEALLGGFILPVVNLIIGPISSFLNFIDKVENFAYEGYATAAWIITVRIPEVGHAIRLYAGHLYHLAEAYAAKLYHLARGYAAHLYHVAVAYAYHVYRLAEAYAHTLVHAARAYSLTLYRAATAYAYDIKTYVLHYAYTINQAALHLLHSEVARLEGLIKVGAGASLGYVDSQVAAALAAAEAYTATHLGGVLSTIDADAAKAAAAVWTGVAADVIALEGIIATDLPDIGALVRAIPRAVPIDLATSLAGVWALERVMVKYLGQCGVPNCRNLSKYGRDLQDLLGAFAVGGLLAALIAMVADPEQGARTFMDGVGGVIEGATHEARTLIGLG